MSAGSSASAAWTSRSIASSAPVMASIASDAFDAHKTHAFASSLACDAHRMILSVGFTLAILSLRVPGRFDRDHDAEAGTTATRARGVRVFAAMHARARSRVDVFQQSFASSARHAQL